MLRRRQNSDMSIIKMWWTDHADAKNKFTRNKESSENYCVRILVIKPTSMIWISGFAMFDTRQSASFRISNSHWRFSCQEQSLKSCYTPIIVKHESFCYRNNYLTRRLDQFYVLACILSKDFSNCSRIDGRHLEYRRVHTTRLLM